MYEYNHGDFPVISMLPCNLRPIPVEIKCKREPRGSTTDPISVFFAFDIDRYAALVKVLNRSPNAESLGQFVRKEVERWTKGNQYFGARYDLSYKPAHIVESMRLRINMSRSMHSSLKKAVNKNHFTMSALIRVLVERKMDETQAIFGV